MDRAGRAKKLTFCAMDSSPAAVAHSVAVGAAGKVADEP